MALRCRSVRSAALPKRRRVTSTPRNSYRRPRRAQGVAWVIVETEGSMIPVVDTAAPTAGEAAPRSAQDTPGAVEEARLSLAHAQGSGTPTFAATLGEPDAVGYGCWIARSRAGLGQTSRVHSVGDGAPWIADQVQRVFGTQGTYLVDFYHLSEHGGGGPPVCPGGPRSVAYAAADPAQAEQCGRRPSGLNPPSRTRRGRGESGSRAGLCLLSHQPPGAI